MKLQAKHSGKFLSVKKGKVCQADDEYEWKVEKVNEYFYITSKVEPTKCLQPQSSIIKDGILVELNIKQENDNKSAMEV